MTKLQEYLKELIEDAKAGRSMTKEQIADAMGISPQQLSNLLGGTNDWSAKRIEKLCEVLGRHLFWPHDDEHGRVHEKLQRILDAGESYRSGIAFVINCIHDSAFPARGKSDDHSTIPVGKVRIVSSEEFERDARASKNFDSVAQGTPKNPLPHKNPHVR